MEKQFTKPIKCIQLLTATVGKSLSVGHQYPTGGLLVYWTFNNSNQLGLELKHVVHNELASLQFTSKPKTGKFVYN